MAWAFSAQGTTLSIQMQMPDCVTTHANIVLASAGVITFLLLLNNANALVQCNAAIFITLSFMPTDPNLGCSDFGVTIIVSNTDLPKFFGRFYVNMCAE